MPITASKFIAQNRLKVQPLLEKYLSGDEIRFDISVMTPIITAQKLS